MAPAPWTPPQLPDAPQRYPRFRSSPTVRLLELLDRHNLPRLLVAALEHHAVGALAHDALQASGVTHTHMGCPRPRGDPQPSPAAAHSTHQHLVLVHRPVAAPGPLKSRSAAPPLSCCSSGGSDPGASCQRSGGFRWKGWHGPHLGERPRAKELRLDWHSGRRRCVELRCRRLRDLAHGPLPTSKRVHTSHPPVVLHCSYALLDVFSTCVHSCVPRAMGVPTTRRDA